MKLTYTKGILFFVFCINLFFISSCSSPENEIILDQTTSFKLPENSKIQTIIQTDVDYFKSLLPDKLNNKMVLYKMIKGINYQLYIGVAIDASFDEINKELSSDPRCNLISKVLDSPQCTSRFLQIDSMKFCFQYLNELELGDKYLYIVTSNYKDQLDQLVKSDFIGKNIIHE